MHKAHTNTKHVDGTLLLKIREPKSVVREITLIPNAAMSKAAETIETISRKKIMACKPFVLSILSTIPFLKEKGQTLLYMFYCICRIHTRTSFPLRRSL
jgi:hypothetical protein